MKSFVTGPGDQGTDRATAVASGATGAELRFGVHGVSQCPRAAAQLEYPKCHTPFKPQDL